MREVWQGTGYDVLTRNCCHFSDELSRQLGVGPLPLWTMSLAGAGAAARGVYQVVAASLHPVMLLGNCCARGDEEEREEPATKGGSHSPGRPTPLRPRAAA